MKRNATMLIAAGATATAIAAIYGAFIALAVPFLNSDLSPVIGAQRYMVDQKSRQTLAETLQNTAETLEKTNRNVDNLSKWQARRDCEDWNRRLRTYNEALRKNPRDAFAVVLKGQALDAIGGLPGCMQEVQ